MNLGMEPPPYDPSHEHQPPEGWRRVTFTGGGTLDGQTKLVRVSVQEGDDYNLIGTAETYRWNGTQFILQNPDIEWPDPEEATMSETETETEPTTEEPTTDDDEGGDDGGEEADGDTDAG